MQNANMQGVHCVFANSRHIHSNYRKICCEQCAANFCVSFLFISGYRSLTIFSSSSSSFSGERMRQIQQHSVDLGVSKRPSADCGDASECRRRGRCCWNGTHLFPIHSLMFWSVLLNGLDDGDSRQLRGRCRFAADERAECQRHW